MGRRKDSSGIKLGRMLLPALFFAFTIGAAIPSEIYFGNIGEFYIRYTGMLPLILAMSAALFAGAAGVALLLRKKRKLLLVWLDLLFGGTLAVYLQQNLLNGELQQLNGTEASWSGTSPLALAGLAVWLVCLAGPHLLRKIRPRLQALVRRYGSALLTVMQVGALAVMMVNAGEPAAGRVALTGKDEFNVSGNGDIIVFVVDTLDAQWAESMVLEQEEYREALKDFTYFNNVVAGGAPTILGIPTLLTGEIYHSGVTLEQYMEKAYRSTSLFSDLGKNGYQVRLYTRGRYLTGANGKEIANSEEGCSYRIRWRKKFLKDLYMMTAYKGLPYQLKKPFTVYSGELTGNYMTEEIKEDDYQLDDPRFGEDLRSGGLTLTENRSFTMYHLFGAHGPYNMDENGNRVKADRTSREQQVQGVFRLISEYMEEMKKLGVYDSSMIVITADHGGVSLYQNPAVFVKMPGSVREAYAVNDTPLTFRNLRASFMEQASGETNAEYGEGMWTENAPRGGTRTHTFDAVLYKNVYGVESEEKGYLTFEFGDPARDDSLIVKPE